MLPKTRDPNVSLLLIWGFIWVFGDNAPGILVIGARTRMLLCYLIITHKYQFSAPNGPKSFLSRPQGEKVSKLKN